MKQSDEIQRIEDAMWAYLKEEQVAKFWKAWEAIDGHFSLKAMAEAVHKAMKEGGSPNV